MSIQEMKEAVASLPPDELTEFAAWLDTYRARHLHSPRPLKEEERPAGQAPPLAAFEPVPYERIAHLAGVLAGGPRDLSTNKRYLEGLGESSTR